ncbi:glycosyltransferase [Winogradskyella sp. 3972H.M.0a.05]|uniref:glycosyltransferase family 2 protein n=1 Tax=Winogradskyella sp. 3972H.M.0a.05 TaxID=2950277 RepID=UPI00339B1CCD
MGDNKPLVSILLPVYNGEKTLRATLQSLLNQTYSNFEIVIGIDGTKDASKDIAQSFNDERISIIEHPENLGLAGNLNEIIKHVQKESKYYAMAEQDDIYVPERLQWQVEVMESKQDIGMVSGIAKFLSDNNEVLFPGLLVRKEQFPRGEAMFKYLYINQLKVVNTCLMWRKDIHDANSLKFTTKYPNMNVDWDFVLRFSLLSNINGIPKVLVEMNRRLDNESVTTNKKQQFETSRLLLKDFKNEFPNLIDASTYKKALKMHRKIELGYRSKIGIITYGFAYFILYLDGYFLNYIKKRTLKFFS